MQFINGGCIFLGADMALSERNMRDARKSSQSLYILVFSPISHISEYIQVRIHAARKCFDHVWGRAYMH